MFFILLRTNSDLCHLHHKLIGFYNRYEKCLLRGTDWVFNSDGYSFVLKGFSTCIYTASLFYLTVIICHCLSTALSQPTQPITQARGGVAAGSDKQRLSDKIRIPYFLKLLVESMFVRH